MIDELRSFALFAEEGSIQAVARRLPLTQPAVSRQIQRLEQIVGTALLDRRQKPPRLTKAGLDVLARAQQILSGVEQIKTLAEGAKPNGTFRLGLVNGLYHPSLPQALAEIAAQFPGVSIRLKSGWSAELAEQHRLGQLDAAIVLSSGTQSYDGRPIGEERLAVICAHDLPETNEHQRWVLSPHPCAARQALAARLAADGHPLIIGAEVEDAALQIGLIREGLGFGLMARRLLSPNLPTGIKVLGDPTDDLRLDVLSLRSPHLGSLSAVVDLLESRMQAIIE